MIKKQLCLVLAFPLFLTCNKVNHRVVDPALEVYVNRFYEEAAMREIDIATANLEVIFRDLSDEGVCGLGYNRYNGTDLRKVEIMPDFFCWEFHDDLGKENLVFHELGHALLNWSHINSILPNGSPATMMCDGNICDVFAYYDKFTRGKRAYYLDKLFRVATVNPIWSRIKTRETPIFNEDFEGNTVNGVFETSINKDIENFSYSVVKTPKTVSNSMHLHSKTKLSNNISGSWVIRIPPENLEEGVGLKLSTTVSTEKLEGNGATIILRTYSSDGGEWEISAAGSTRNSAMIHGNISEKKYSTSINYYPSDVQQIEMIFQLLPNTSGTVYFDDIELSLLEF